MEFSFKTLIPLKQMYSSRWSHSYWIFRKCYECDGGKQTVTLDARRKRPPYSLVGIQSQSIDERYPNNCWRKRTLSKREFHFSQGPINLNIKRQEIMKILLKVFLCHSVLFPVKYITPKVICGVLFHTLSTKLNF